MVFASLTFLYIFLPLNLVLYYLFPNRIYQNALLTLFSFCFYAWGEPVWISLLILSATGDYFFGRLIEQHKHTRKAKVYLISSVTINLSLLFIFKYSGFIIDNINGFTGLSIPKPEFDGLPVGISFYTFQTISYTIDVYRGQVKAQKSWLNFMLFVSLYHQLVAGPIVRYSEIANEIENRVSRLTDISMGITRFCIGLFKKVFIANVAGALVDKYLQGDISHLSVAEAWFGIIMYSIQIYFDFSGYSDMAIGLGKMFGFNYGENFVYPYISTSVTEFWRRWHISLGTFFKDYIYIPLGGNKTKAIRNLFVVWLLTGLWHGASWNFVLWGMYFGSIIWIERAFLLNYMKNRPAIFSHVYLLFFAVIGWAIFYFEDLHQLGAFFAILFGFSGHELSTPEFIQVFWAHINWMLLAFILCMPVYNYVTNKGRELVLQPRFAMLWIMVIVFNLSLLFMSSALLVGKSYNPFIYYRF